MFVCPFYLNMAQRTVAYVILGTLLVVSTKTVQATSTFNPGDAVRATVAQGELEGVVRLTKQNLVFQTDPIAYAAFEGIPFAQPPVGKLRFKNPLPPHNWTGIYNATKTKARCAQISEITGIYEGEEDCLHLDVYTRYNDPTLLRPVFVVFFGGRFRTGPYTRYHEDPFIEMDVVVVHINFRLNIFGLLSLNTEDAPGNLIIKDMVLALKWIKTNIGSFGGDPNNVALYGVSSGAASIYLIQSSPMAKGLFHKTIMESAVFLCDWTRPTDSVEVVKDFAGYIGLNTTDEKAILKYLMEQPAEKLCYQTHYFEYDREVQVFKFSLKVDKPIRGLEPSLPRTPLMAHKSSTFNYVPTMICFGSRESAFFYRNGFLEGVLKREDLLVPEQWRIPYKSKLFKDCLEKVKQFYFNTQEINISRHDHVENMILLLGDIEFFIPTSNTIRTHAQYSNSPTFVYRFSYRGGLNSPNIERLGLQGASHSDSRNYLFGISKKPIPMYTSDNMVRRKLARLYRNFLEKSDPTPEPLSHTVPFKWLPFTNSSKHYLEFNGDIALSQDFEARRIAFWDELEQFVIKEGHMNVNWRDTCTLK